MNFQLTILRVPIVNGLHVRGFKHFPAPPNFDHIELPEKPKLKFIDKVPQYGVRPFKMQKKLRLIRGEEDVHNFLLHKQYGIKALSGGRLQYGHFEMIRLTLGRKLDYTKMFATWRVDAPWQPITKKSLGMRMGGGKAAIDHYATPVKAERIIVEVGGKCEYEEVRAVLEDIAMKLPFKAMAVSQEILDETAAKEKWEEENNQNPYTMKYLIQNNMGGCQRWISPLDFKHFGKHI